MKPNATELLQWSQAELADHLTRRLLARRIKPGRSFAPQLAYGRHRGPARRSSRIAAVAITLFQHDQLGWTIPLTLRPTTLMHHGGQICFPGGRAERGETMLQAATREYTEELGVRPRVHRACGELASYYVYASDNQVHPMVIVTDPPEQAWQPDPVEVAKVILLPVSQLIDPDRRQRTSHRRLVVSENGSHVGEVKFSAPAIEVRNRDQVHRVWGATAMMLHQLAQLLL
ncbi:putative NUDIX hydrolase [Rubripirellula obstinata]|uniref:Putative NUDIX hydrolase n=1 Tax=Rubripirellula obstinata TaxID=406547 RepID=A0A5B1CHC3_9BACT|nr:CoA pyrophosphatase [Rubripirellula obstinata]KAA1258970.1 putative NUDIX hydrolase [Rubripirellula obstinata]